MPFLRHCTIWLETRIYSIKHWSQTLSFHFIFIPLERLKNIMRLIEIFCCQFINTIFATAHLIKQLFWAPPSRYSGHWFPYYETAVLPDLNRNSCLWDLRFNWFIKLAHSQLKLIPGMCLSSLSVTLTLVTASHVTSSSMSGCQSHNPCFKMLTVTRLICNTAWITLADVLCVTTLQFLLLLSMRTLFRLV